MTTMTKEAPQRAETETKRWTLREVEKQEATLQDLRAQVEELAEKEKALKARIAETRAAGEDPSGLQEEFRETRDLREDLEGVEPVLEGKIEERRRAAFHALFEERLHEIKKKRGGIAGEHPRRVERLRKAVEAAEKELAKMQDAYAVDRAFNTESRTIAELTGLALPDMQSVPSLRQDREVIEIVGRARKLVARAGGVSPSRKGPAESARLAARELKKRGQETDTPTLVRRYREHFGEDDDE